MLKPGNYESNIWIRISQFELSLPHHSCSLLRLCCTRDLLGEAIEKYW